MQSFTDQTGHIVTLAAPPKRVVSLVPSQTELLFSLGLTDEVVGITKFCIHPGEWFNKKTRIGGTKTVNLQQVLALEPDLIIANKEENTREQVKALQSKVPVYTSDIYTLHDALSMIAAIGQLVGKTEKARSIIGNIENGFIALKDSNDNNQNTLSTSPVRAAYLIWKDPWMAAGGNTFIHAMLEKCGFVNVFADAKRYPTITIEELATAGCNCVLLSTEPYPFKQKHIEELQKQLPQTRILLADGEMFSWYGSRLQFAPAYFMQLRQTILSNQLH